MSDHELVSELKGIRMDLTALQGRISECLRQAGNLTPKPAKTCPDCGCSFPGRNGLAEHAYQSHGAELPDHWRAAERSATDDLQRGGWFETADERTERQALWEAAAVADSHVGPGAS